MQEDPKPIKPKVSNVKEKSKPKAGDLDDTDISEFIIGCFALLAAIMGEHWTVTKSEAHLIADPLTKILNKWDKKKKENLSASMAPILLASAIATVFVPKILIQMEVYKRARERNRKPFIPDTGSDTGKALNTSREPSPEIDRKSGSESGRNAASIPDSGETIPSVPPALRGLINEGN